MTRDEALDALAAVPEALDIPHAATVGDEEVRAKILDQRVGHTVVMLQSILHEKHPAPDAAWSIGYLRARLAEHPVVGYRTWDERVAELDAAKARDGVPTSAGPRAERGMGAIVRPIFGGQP